jgi:hypothetical protein
MNPKIARWAGVFAVSLLVSSAPSYAGRCDPTGADAGDIAAAREAIAANCDCATAENHGAYVSCVAAQVKATVGNPSCRGGLKKCAARSTCGKPGFVTCCRTKASGRTKCSTKSSADRCTAPRGGSACVGNFASCCDACTDGGCASPSGAFLGD